MKGEKNYNDPTVPSEYRNTTLYYHYNHRGDTVSVSDGSGTHIWQSDYDAFGQPLPVKSASGTFAPRYTFSTKRYFPELGTYYYGYRWYLPELCRWLQKDPIHAQLQNNAFAFNRNLPLFFIDPNGLSPVPITDKSQLPFADKIDQKSFDRAKQEDRQAAYNTLTQIQNEGGTPNGQIEIDGERVRIEDGVTWKCGNNPIPDSKLATQLKAALEKLNGKDLQSSAHFPGSPSLNEAQFSGSDPEYNTDLHNPNESYSESYKSPDSLNPGMYSNQTIEKSGLAAHAVDAASQAFGQSLSDEVYDEYEKQGKITPPPPPPPAGAGGAPPSAGTNPPTPPPPPPPPRESNQPPSHEREAPGADGNGTCTDHSNSSKN